MRVAVCTICAYAEDEIVRVVSQENHELYTKLHGCTRWRINETSCWFNIIYMLSFCSQVEWGTTYLWTLYPTSCADLLSLLVRRFRRRRGTICTSTLMQARSCQTWERGWMWTMVFISRSSGRHLRSEWAESGREGTSSFWNSQNLGRIWFAISASFSASYFFMTSLTTDVQFRNAVAHEPM